jgi:hypothetical protein
MLGNITCGGKLIAFPVDPEAYVRKVGGDQNLSYQDRLRVPYLLKLLSCWCDCWHEHRKPVIIENDGGLFCFFSEGKQNLTLCVILRKWSLNFEVSIWKSVTSNALSCERLNCNVAISSFERGAIGCLSPPMSPRCSNTEPSSDMASFVPSWCGSVLVTLYPRTISISHGRPSTWERCAMVVNKESAIEHSEGSWGRGSSAPAFWGSVSSEERKIVLEAL